MVPRTMVWIVPFLIWADTAQMIQTTLIPSHRFVIDLNRIHLKCHTVLQKYKQTRTRVLSRGDRISNARQMFANNSYSQMVCR